MFFVSVFLIDFYSDLCCFPCFFS